MPIKATSVIDWKDYEILLIDGLYHYRINGVVVMTSTRDLSKEM